MFDLTLREAKAGFFDVKGVKKAIGKGAAKALARFGAFVRKRARTSIRKRKKSSPPGKPPSSHRGDLRRLILFALTRDRKQVHIGPVKFGKGEAPRLLEHSGTVTRKRAAAKAQGRPASVRQKKAFRKLLREGRIMLPPATYETVTYRYRGNPFMAPAGKAELGKFRDLLKKMVK